MKSMSIEGIGESRVNKVSKKRVNSNIIKRSFSSCRSKKDHCMIQNGLYEKYIEKALQEKLLLFLEGNVAYNNGACNFCNFEKSPAFSLLAQQVFQQIKNPPYHEDELKKLYIKAKIQEWQVHIQASLKQYNPNNRMQSDDLLISEVQRFLLANIKKTPSLTQLAYRFSTTEKKLNKQFKKSSNMTVFSWVREQRMQKAVELLQKGEHSIKKIAQDCGFKYQSDFAISFKKKFQLTPMEFKKRLHRSL